MSKDVILKDDEGNLYSLENLREKNWLDGHVPGVKEAAAWVAEIALSCFREGNDKDAVLLRNLSKRMLDELATRVARKALENTREHPEIVGRDKKKEVQE